MPLCHAKPILSEAHLLTCAQYQLHFHAAACRAPDPTADKPYQQVFYCSDGTPFHLVIAYITPKGTLRLATPEYWVYSQGNVP